MIHLPVGICWYICHIVIFLALRRLHYYILKKLNVFSPFISCNLGFAVKLSMGVSNKPDSFGCTGLHTYPRTCAVLTQSAFLQAGMVKVDLLLSPADTFSEKWTLISTFLFHQGHVRISTWHLVPYHQSESKGRFPGYVALGFECTFDTRLGLIGTEGEKPSRVATVLTLKDLIHLIDIGLWEKLSSLQSQGNNNRQRERRMGSRPLHGALLGFS